MTTQPPGHDPNDPNYGTPPPSQPGYQPGHEASDLVGGRSAERARSQARRGDGGLGKR